MSKFNRIECRKLQPGNIIRSGDEGYVVKEIEVKGRHLEISLQGTGKIIEASPDKKVYIEKVEELFDFDEAPTGMYGWQDDGSYMTESGVVCTASEMENAAYSGAEFD